MLQDGVNPISTYPWFNNILRITLGTYFLSFIAGIILNILTQSTLAVAAIMLSIYKTGLISLPEMMMILYGSCLGSSIIVLFFAYKLSGASKQVAMFQVIYNFVGVLILVPLFYIEIYAGIPLFIALIEHFFSDITLQVPATIVLFDCLTGVILFPMRNIIYKFLEKFCPELIDEAASKPKYISKYSMEAPALAIELIEKEQIQQLEYLSYEFNLLRNKKDTSNFYNLFEAMNNLSLEIHEFILTLLSQHATGKEFYTKMNLLLQIQNYIGGINENIASVIEKSILINSTKENTNFLNVIIEGIDAIFITLLKVAQEKDRDEIINLELMTSGSGEKPSLIRKAYLELNKSNSDSDQIYLLSLCDRCERIIWLLKNLGKCYRTMKE